MPALPALPLHRSLRELIVIASIPSTIPARHGERYFRLAPPGYRHVFASPNSYAVSPILNIAAQCYGKSSRIRLIGCPAMRSSTYRR